jgi:hypothetical protein
VKYVVAAVLLAHGIAHLPGFAVPWRLMTSSELPYATTLLSGRWDVGDTGIRIVGIVWLMLAAVFVAVAASLAIGASWTVGLLISSALASFVLCALNWPQARIGLFVNLAVLLSVPLIGQSVWQDASARRVRSLASLAVGANEIFKRASLDSLPAPAARYFSRVLTDGQPTIATARFEQAGDFRVGQTWHPFSATQRFTVEPAGFVWDARIMMSAALPVLVRDAYVDGSGSMRGEILGVYPLVNQSNRPELDSGALQRFLAEAVWFPTALLPRRNLRWDPIDDHRARVTLTDRRTTVSLEFRFNDDGDVTEIFAPDRYAEDNGRYVPKPWIVRCSEYATHAGMRIPMRCEVAWVEAAGPEPYWRGRITDARYSGGVAESDGNLPSS